MLSFLSLCIPREWRLYFSVLSGLLCLYRYIDSGKRLLVRQLEVVNGVPFRGRIGGGESERGRKGIHLEEDPSVWRFPLWLIFEKNVVLKSHSKNSGGKKGFMSDFFEL